MSKKRNLARRIERAREIKSLKVYISKMWAEGRMSYVRGRGIDFYLDKGCFRARNVALRNAFFGMGLKVALAKYDVAYSRDVRRNRGY